MKKLKLDKIKITNLNRTQLLKIKGGDDHILGPKNKTKTTQQDQL